MGAGPDLGNVSAVNGHKGVVMALVSKGPTTPVSVLKVDPKTGDRALAWTSEKQPCKGLKGKFEVDRASLAVGPDGTAYLSVWNYPVKGTGLGVVAIKGGACEVTSMSGAEGNVDAKGAGPTIGGLSPFKQLNWGPDGKVWALHPMTNSLVTFEPATGNRARVSSGQQAFQVGQGPEMGYAAAAFGAAKTYTVGNWTAGGSFRLTEVAANGDRKSGPAVSGPVNRTQDHPTGVYQHPSKPLLILSVENGFYVLDPATGESNALSL